MRVKIRDDVPDNSVPFYLTKGKVFDAVYKISSEVFEKRNGSVWWEVEGDVLCDNKELDSLKRGLAEMKLNK